MFRLRPFVQRNFRCNSIRTLASSSSDPLPLGINNNEALAKYRHKLQQKAEQEGFKTVEELLLHGAAKKKPAAVQAPTNQSLSAGAAPAPVSSKPSTAFTKQRKEGLPSYVKTLDELVDLDKLNDETSDRIEFIWNEFHSTKNGMVSGVMKADFYSQLKAKGKEYPMFILPLARESGVEFFILQFAFNQIYYTSLLEYKTHLTESRPRLTLTHYDDLSESKNIVLMRGEISREGGILKADDARLLVLMTQIFYVTGSEAKKKLVETFNKNPSEFQYQALIDEMEKLE
ncbi:hypothetical protein HDU79_005806 [Rhizoclosmatium sp. JEL0117]|nr:hypothetical protein HDU79_005806 [Rhizoclosmatium sp. JEL0117]